MNIYIHFKEKLSILTHYVQFQGIVCLLKNRGTFAANRTGLYSRFAANDCVQSQLTVQSPK